MQIFKTRISDALFICLIYGSHMLKHHGSGSSDLTARSSAVANKGCWNTHSVSHSPAAARGQVNSEHKLRLHNGAVRAACCIKHKCANLSLREMPCLDLFHCFWDAFIFCSRWKGVIISDSSDKHTLQHSLCSMSQCLRVGPTQKAIQNKNILTIVHAFYSF